MGLYGYNLLKSGPEYTSPNGALQRENGPMGMTIVEKIFARASGQPRVSPGDLAVVDVDVCVMLDASFHVNGRRKILKAARSGQGGDRVRPYGSGA